MSSDRTATRREFLRWMGLAPGAAAALASSAAALGACSDEAGQGPGTGADGGSDAGLVDVAADGADVDLGGVDAGHEEVGEVVCEATASDLEGPFFIEGAPERTALATAEEPGERLTISGVVYGPDCETPLSGALLDVWQADAEGAYHDDTETYRLRGQLLTDENGAFSFDTIRPGHYPQAGGMRPAHIHFMVAAPGHRALTTQLYFAGDPWLAPADPCTVCNSEADTLIIPLEEEAAGEATAWRGRFEIVLQRA